MSELRNAVAGVPVVVLLATAPVADAATVRTLPCVPYVAGALTMPIAGSGFLPGGFVTLATSSAADRAPSPLASARVDAAGGFQQVSKPPRFSSRKRNLQSFELVATDRTNPTAPMVAMTSFRMVRFGMTRTPDPKRPRQRVTYTARGFEPGRRVYAHFRFAGVTRRTISLGIATGACGITSRRINALPTSVRYGTWRTYVDQSRSFSRTTRPQWVDVFRIDRVARQ